jgi:hypothetical protein
MVEVEALLERLRVLLDGPARERADRLAELAWATDRVARQNGTAPGTPGAGVTITRSRVMSSIRQLVAPSRKVWPGRAS